MKNSKLIKLIISTGLVALGIFFALNDLNIVTIAIGYACCFAASFILTGQIFTIGSAAGTSFIGVIILIIIKIVLYPIFVIYYGLFHNWLSFIKEAIANRKNGGYKSSSSTGRSSASTSLSGGMDVLKQRVNDLCKNCKFSANRPGFNAKIDFVKVEFMSHSIVFKATVSIDTGNNGNLASIEGEMESFMSGVAKEIDSLQNKTDKLIDELIAKGYHDLAGDWKIGRDKVRCRINGQEI